MYSTSTCITTKNSLLESCLGADYHFRLSCRERGKSQHQIYRLKEQNEICLLLKQVGLLKQVKNTPCRMDAFHEMLVQAKEQDLKETAVELGLQVNKVSMAVKQLDRPASKALVRTDRLGRATDRQGSLASMGTVRRARYRSQKKGPSSQEHNGLYQTRIKSYRQFLLKACFASGLNYSPQLCPFSFRKLITLKAFVGKGNNSNLVKSLVKRRYWWKLTDKIEEAQFVWTQLKIGSVHARQGKAAPPHRNRKGSPDRLKFTSSKKTKKKTVIKKEGESNRQPKTAQGSAKLFSELDAKEYGQEGDDPFKDQEFVEELRQRRVLVEPQSRVVHNHFPKNFFLGNKKALFHVMRRYYEWRGKDPFQVLPLTFHFAAGTQSPDYRRFLKEFQAGEERRREEEEESLPHRNIWIVKPGQNSNRGFGITVVEELYQVERMVNSRENGPDGKLRTYIVQKYMERPLLYNGRKFDIRHYFVVTRINGILRGYWSFDGYVRTSGRQFSLEELDDRVVHLTNDAVQKCSAEYGRFEPANKLSYAQFQRYLDMRYPKRGWNFFRQVYPQMREITKDALTAIAGLLDPERLQSNFQIFGLDFMIDARFKPWLIEVNTNPCLELPCCTLERIIPALVEQSLRLVLDAQFPPPMHYPPNARHLVPDCSLDKLRLELLYDEQRDGVFPCRAGEFESWALDEEEEQFQDDGKSVADDLVL